MIRLTIAKPLSVGTITTKDYANYALLEPSIERAMERLADRGYDICELPGSNSKSGTIEVTRDDLADILVYQWDTLYTERTTK